MISVENLAVRAGQFALSGISFSIPTGQCGSLMGKTGTGKTTILEALCGLKPVSNGRICLMGNDVTNLKPALRGIGYVPQDGALFPSLSVREHLAFALAIRRWDAAAIELRVQELATLLGLENLLDRGVGQLSGGEAQRTALGRALSNHPEVLCLDEPLSALDEDTRGEMCDVLKTVRERTGVTILYVTHSLEEARTLADQIFVLKDGRIYPDGPMKANPGSPGTRPAQES
ncbi:MAG: ABC transporter ATP-binding protein [Pedosphaera sp.]|nr:ABC transporter ATP-binding protein [Pedosphaera sp.]